MTGSEITALRTKLNLSQVEFAQLFGAHFMTVSKWERGRAYPSAYQEALLRQFETQVRAREAESAEAVKKLLIGAGVIAALAWLLGAR